MDVLVLGQQVTTDHGGKIDILAMESSGDLVIIELKRNRTPRDVTAQILDYASWVAELTTKQVYDVAERALGRSLQEAFHDRFGAALPENINDNHSMIIVAGELDDSSRRIVEYLAAHHGLNINTAFFSVFESDGEQFLATDWLMDQQEVVERAESKTKAPWTGYYYVNVGDMPGYRHWSDMRQYGFIAAGGDPFHSNRLRQLDKGAPVYAYYKNHDEKRSEKAGYVGFGIVTAPPVMARDFRLSDGRALSEVELKEPGLLHDADNQALSEYLVKVEWQKTFPADSVQTFKRAFANQNAVCKLRDPKTLDFLADKFGILKQNR